MILGLAVLAALSGCAGFGQIGTGDMHFLRLSIATGMEDLKIGMERMAEAISDREGFARFIEAGEHFS